MKDLIGSSKYFTSEVALGGSCHWCTEALFQSLKGVLEVKQGYAASYARNESFSEAVTIQFNKDIISLKTLIEIHLYTHKCTANHSMREKYRSAIYTYGDAQAAEAKNILTLLQKQFKEKIITKVLPLKTFKLSEEQFHNYYYSNPEKPFCTNYISPKLQFLLQKFSTTVDKKKIAHLDV